MVDRREINQRWYGDFDERRMAFVMYGTDEDADGDDQEEDEETEEEEEAEEEEDDDETEDDEEDEEAEPRNVWLVPARYEVCGTCDGKGKHVNPSIDSNGLTAEDFDRDPDFFGDYMSGMYDVPCNECHGRRVSPVPDWDRMDAASKKRLERIIDEHHADEVERWNERRMGY